MRWINWVAVLLLSGGAARGVIIGLSEPAFFALAAVSALLCIPLILVNLGLKRSGFWSCLVLGLIGLPLSLWGFHLVGILVYSLLLWNAYRIKYPAKEIL